MFTVRLPNGKEQTFDAALSLEEVLRNTTFNSEQDAIACRVNGKLAHGSYTISHDALLEIITSADEDGLRILRHSTAHLLACAVKTLFPDAKVAMGPVIEDGFYYDFSYPRPFTRENMAEIESKMRELAKKNEPIVRKPIPHQEALQYFQSIGENYKCEILESIPKDEEITLYNVGNFTDLCRGPHVSSTGILNNFKLLSVAGAYWLGDANNEMLQRI